MYSEIQSNGWCTPWAEVLDTVNVFLFQINDKEEHCMLAKYAKELGAGLAESISDATHILANPLLSSTLLKGLVFVGKRSVGRRQPNCSVEELVSDVLVKENAYS